MAKHEQNRAVRVYHSLVAILLLLAGGALLGVGIWLQATDNGGPLDLEYSGNNFFKFVLHLGIAAIIVGGFLIITAIVSLLALSRKLVGVTFRVVYVVLAMVILAALVFVCVISVLARVKGDSDTVREFIFDAWERTVQNNPSEICSVEENLECRGFFDFDCADCVDSTCRNSNVCAPCGGGNVNVGCYTKITDTIDNVFLPMAIVSGILSGVVLLDILSVCCL